ncbi:alpha/beta hydrolase [Croceicoccus sp. BE223]|uniref:alpha/beta hydrolase n=1 Tax=Croceicoccus sp. BE223 TaxID=2817716 RepID=UPI0028643093|nr:alpha/beta hydrolase [Croceicoccus sp. BE223]MDR7100907.1 pimeloyl-ACP methyl ester carboxylesterase [Croceicoccus sp. BE223]
MTASDPTEPDLPPIRRFTSAGGLSLAFRHAAGSGPLIVFLPGYMSDMAGSKACAVMADAIARGQACLLLDYSGCGQSEGDFGDGTLTRWRDEVLALIDHVGAGRPDRPVVLVGSSMGGWLMLLLTEALAARAGPDAVRALVGIAPAPDFVTWGYSDDQKATLERGEVWLEENIYGPEPTPYHPAFYRDALALPRLDERIALSCPVRILQGQQDPDVPWQTALRLADALAASDVHVHLVKDGDHRLSRDADIALLLSTVRGFGS